MISLFTIIHKVKIIIHIDKMTYVHDNIYSALVYHIRTSLKVYSLHSIYIKHMYIDKIVIYIIISTVT